VATTPIREKCAVTTATGYVAGDTNQSESLKTLEFVKQKLHNKLTPSTFRPFVDSTFPTFYNDRILIETEELPV
jgi:hypothetical protein